MTAVKLHAPPRPPHSPPSHTLNNPAPHAPHASHPPGRQPTLDELKEREESKEKEKDDAECDEREGADAAEETDDVGRNWQDSVQDGSSCATAQKPITVLAAFAQESPGRAQEPPATEQTAPGSHCSVPSRTLPSPHTAFLQLTHPSESSLLPSSHCSAGLPRYRMPSPQRWYVQLKVQLQSKFCPPEGGAHIA